MSNELQRVRVKNKAYKPLPVLRVYISKDNGKMRLLLSTFYKRYKVKHFVQIIWRIFLTQTFGKSSLSYILSKRFKDDALVSTSVLHKKSHLANYTKSNCEK